MPLSEATAVGESPNQPGLTYKQALDSYYVLKETGGQARFDGAVHRLRMMLQDSGDRPAAFRNWSDYSIQLLIDELTDTQRYNQLMESARAAAADIMAA